MKKPTSTKKGKPKKLVLFDVYGIIYRAYHALPNFASSKGEPTGALYGLASMLIRIIADLKPDYMAACYDVSDATTFRKQTYDQYKAHRKKTDDELITQIKISPKIFEAFNIPIYLAKGFEADDVIGTIVELTKKEPDLQVVIASGDMDTLQLVDDDRVVVYTLKKGINDTIVYNQKLVEERFGFPPVLLPDYKGLRGDPSDNIIGVPGIGEKTAGILIQEFGTLESFFKVLGKSEAKVLAAGISPRIVGILKEHEEEALFSKILATIRRDAPIKFSLPAVAWSDGREDSKVEKLFRELEFRTLIGRLKQISTTTSPSSEAPDSEATEHPAATEEVDPHLLRETALALSVLDSEKSSPTLEDILVYAGVNTFAEARAFILLELKRHELERVYREVELPLIPIITAAEQRGILVDVAYLKKLSKEYHTKLAAVEKKIYKLAGSEFNINSPRQLGEILFDKLKLTAKGLKKTAGGARSTRESELDKLRDSHPIIEEILAHRELQKLLSTYIDTIPTMVDKDKRLHTTLNQIGAATGRMSSNNPNLQNIPAREGLGAAIRQAFIASPGHTLVAFDYSQIEMRVLALLSGDESLRQIFAEGQDVHTSVAARVFKVAPEAVTKDMRRQAKVINFGIIYGMGVNALRQNLGGSREEAQAFYDNFFKTFPTIHHYFDEVKQEAARLGYTTTIYGRRRYFPGMKSKLPYLRAMAERMAMNAPLQGSAADIVKVAMRVINESLKQQGLLDKAHFLLQIHDELLFEIETSAVGAAEKLIKQAMEKPLPLEVPLQVTCAEGPSWGELKAVK